MTYTVAEIMDVLEEFKKDSTIFLGSIEEEGRIALIIIEDEKRHVIFEAFKAGAKA